MGSRLIVNADDYGYTSGVSAGIRESHLFGIVTSTSVMMNTKSVSADLVQAQKECPNLGLGVHLVLTDGIPLLPPTQVKSLIGDHGFFPTKSQFISRLSQLKLAEVKAEWSAQIEKFIEITGAKPDHLDSHHHVSYFSSNLFQIMLELAQKHECSIRLPSGLAAIDVIADLPYEFAKDNLMNKYYLVNNARIRYPTYFMQPWFSNRKITSCGLVHLFQTLPEGVSELVCHPGYADPDLLKISDYAKQREAELITLTDFEIWKFVKERKIEMINFAQL